jgi:hypothetical protein
VVFVFLVEKLATLLKKRFSEFVNYFEFLVGGGWAGRRKATKATAVEGPRTLNTYDLLQGRIRQV